MASVRLERDGPVLRIALARPEVRNAFDAATIAELTTAFGEVGDAHVIVLSGDGPAFSAGADIGWMRASAELSRAENAADALRARRMFETVASCPAPVVCRVQGAAIGGALGLVACADVAVAAPDAVFAFSEVRLGIIPAVISPFVLERIGPGATRRYFVTAERFDALEARRIGLVHEVAEHLDGTVERVVGEILRGGPEAVRAAKRLVLDAPLGDEVAERLAERRTSAEGQEGLRAFLDRRLPAWADGGSNGSPAGGR
jgi:methylglutaconyl-CoA hydratase